MLSSKDCGVVDKHIGILQTVARENKCFIFIRPVNSFSTGLIEQGFGTKGLDIHGKSSDWGPQAGFICSDQALSKVAGNADKVEHGNKEVVKSLKYANVGETALVLPKARLQELIDLNVIPNTALNGSPFSAGKPDKGGAKVSVSFKLTPAGSDRFKVEYQVGKDWKDVMVIGYKESGAVIAVTADYDLFAVSPHFSASPSMKTITKASARGLEGVLTDYQRRVNGIINTAIGGKKVVNHGTELNNPFPENDPRLAMFTAGGDSRMIDRISLEKLFGDMVQRGFHAYANELWNTATRGRIGAQIMGRLRNPARRGDLRPTKLQEDDFGGLDLREFPEGATLAEKMENFALMYLDNTATLSKPRWQ